MEDHELRNSKVIFIVKRIHPIAQGKNLNGTLRCSSRITLDRTANKDYSLKKVISLKYCNFPACLTAWKITLPGSQTSAIHHRSIEVESEEEHQDDKDPFYERLLGSLSLPFLPLDRGSCKLHERRQAGNGF